MHNDLKQCPYCAEFIKRDAVKCRFCGSMVGNATNNHPHPDNADTHWVRPLGGRVLGGICAGIAAELNAPQMVLLFRLFFIFAVFFWGTGLGIYIILWFLMPSEQRMSPQHGHASQSSYDTSRQPPVKQSPLATLFIVIFIIIAGIAVLNIFSHFIPWWHGFYIPSFHIPFMTWHRFYPFGGFFSSPNITGFGVVLAISLLFILLLTFFKFFRAALGCFGILLGIAIIAILAPVLLPVFIVPLALLIPILIWAIPILLILWLLKLLID